MKTRGPSTKLRTGFTLIELLLVLLLVALLAALVAPVVTGGIQRARESTLKEDLYALRKAIDGVMPTRARLFLPSLGRSW